VVNGETRKLRDKEYMPDVMHQHVTDFVTTNRDKPFYLYYSLSHVHAEILPTPESAPGSKDIYADNIAYMDKVVGKLMAELDRLKLRGKTLVIFVGDNGTANGKADRATIGGKPPSGAKGSMLEGGGLVPMVASWPGLLQQAGIEPASSMRAISFRPSPSLRPQLCRPGPSSMAAASWPSCAARRACLGNGPSMNSPGCGTCGRPAGS
jgi:arylsulfatase A